MDQPISTFTKKQLETMLYSEPTKIKVEGVNLTFEGVIPKIQKSMLSKDVEAMQPHVRRFVERAITFQTCPECDGTRLSAEATRRGQLTSRRMSLSRLQSADDLTELRDVAVALPLEPFLGQDAKLKSLRLGGLLKLNTANSQVP